MCGVVVKVLVWELETGVLLLDGGQTPSTPWSSVFLHREAGLNVFQVLGSLSVL